eukprot:Nitzschia sp. Nitz4//scaffold2_size372955//333736//338351//NITZ4_000472-RA/size372955-processed-gene-0.138-mRNA-1//-1//CDS//3329546925//1355//frame0
MAKAPKKNRKPLSEPPFLLSEGSGASFDKTLDGVVRLLQGRKNIVVLVGAGISVSCGIPDFRSKESGLYSNLDTESLGLSCPEDLFDLSFFMDEPGPFYAFAKHLYYPQGEEKKVEPSDSHRLLALLEQRKMLLRVYSQNIDGLENVAGVSNKKIVYAHGSLQWAKCTRCQRKVFSDEIMPSIRTGTVARCRAEKKLRRGSSSSSAATPPGSSPRESLQRQKKRPRTPTEEVCGGVIKPCVTFFGETLNDTVRRSLETDREKVDALVVIGTSLSVARAPEDEPDFRENYVFDAYLLGYCDDVTRCLAKRLFEEDNKGSAPAKKKRRTDMTIGRLLTSVCSDLTMIRAACTLQSGLNRQLSKNVAAAMTSPLSASLDVSSVSTKESAIPNHLSFQRRTMATSPEAPKENFNETMDKIFETQKAASGEGDAWFLEEAANAAWEPSWYNLADQAINGVHLVHDLTGLHYAGSIFAATCIIRMAILPVAIRGQRAASRMAHIQPELQVLKKRYEALGTPTRAEQQAFADQMKALFARYDVKPFQSLLTPLISAPIFIGMFFGMKKMPELFPTEFATGGLLWFTDLTIPDPTYILPITCGLSFLATVEAGKDQMIDSSPETGPMMVNAFRALACVAVPVMTTFPSAMLCYWVPNNFITLVQSVALRHPTVKQHFGIWDRPKPVPGLNNNAGFQETMSNLVKQVQGEPTTEAAKIKKHNEEIETKKRMNQMSKKMSSEDPFLVRSWNGPNNVESLQENKTRTNPKLVLHLDINETILLGDDAGGDTRHDSVQKMLAKSAFCQIPSLASAIDQPDGSGRPTKQQILEKLEFEEPTHWWDGQPMGKETSMPPLYTGWDWPPGCCPYYRTAFKDLSKKFVEEHHGRIYRPVLDACEDALRDPHTNLLGDHILGALYHTLNYLIQRGQPFQVIFRTFGSDLSEISKLVTAFAQGKHPNYPDVHCPALELPEDSLYQGRWKVDENGSTKYQLWNSKETELIADGDEQALQFLSKHSICGVRGDYLFWRKNNFVPTAGKPVWRPFPDDNFVHHILFDDNIHHLNHDCIACLREQRNDGTFHTVDPARMHSEFQGVHLVRVPTVEPVLNPNWFVEQIEAAQQRLEAMLATHAKL